MRQSLQNQYIVFLRSALGKARNADITEEERQLADAFSRELLGIDFSQMITEDIQPAVSESGSQFSFCEASFLQILTSENNPQYQSCLFGVLRAALQQYVKLGSAEERDAFVQKNKPRFDQLLAGLRQRYYNKQKYDYLCYRGFADLFTGSSIPMPRLIEKAQEDNGVVIEEAKGSKGSAKAAAAAKAQEQEANRRAQEARARARARARAEAKSATDEHTKKPSMASADGSSPATSGFFSSLQGAAAAVAGATSRATAAVGAYFSGDGSDIQLNTISDFCDNFGDVTIIDLWNTLESGAPKPEKLKIFAIDGDVAEYFDFLDDDEECDGSKVSLTRPEQGGELSLSISLRSDNTSFQEPQNVAKLFVDWMDRSVWPLAQIKAILQDGNISKEDKPGLCRDAINEQRNRLYLTLDELPLSLFPDGTIAEQAYRQLNIAAQKLGYVDGGIKVASHPKLGQDKRDKLEVLAQTPKPV